MAAGNTLVAFTAAQATFPATIPAVPSTRNRHPILKFDASTDWRAFFEGIMPRHYGGGGITATIMWTAVPTAGDVIWEMGFERQHAAGDDLDAESFAANQFAAADTTDATSGKLTYTTITFTDGAQMDSVAAGEGFRIVVRRDADDTNGTDDCAGFAELWKIELRETP